MYDSGYAAGRTVFNTDSAYYIVGATSGDGTGAIYPRVAAWKFDSLGAFLWQKEYYDTLNPLTNANENACKRVQTI